MRRLCGKIPCSMRQVSRDHKHWCKPSFPRAASLLICLACLMGSPCMIRQSSYADTIWLRSGTKYNNATVIEETDTKLVLQLPGGKTITVPRSAVVGRIVDTKTRRELEPGKRSTKLKSETNRVRPKRRTFTRFGWRSIHAFRNADGTPIITNIPAKYDAQYEEVLTELEHITLYRPGDVRTSQLLKRALSQETRASDERRRYSVRLRREFDELIEEFIIYYSDEYGVPPELVMAVIKAESNFNPKAVSSKGAQGLMQLMPRTAAAMGITDCFDPGQNIGGGTQYLSKLLKMFGDEELAVAAYNAGPGRVRQYGGIPPYRETREYVARVFRHRDRYARQMGS